MKYFKTKDGKKFGFELTIGKCRKIAAKFELDFLDQEPQELLEQLIQRPLLRLDLMYELLVEEISQEEFEEHLVGDTIGHAEEALLDEIIFFTQTLNPPKAAMLTKLRVTMDRLMDRQLEAIDKVMDGDKFTKAMSTFVDKAEKEFLEAFDDACTNLQEQSE